MLIFWKKSKRPTGDERQPDILDSVVAKDEKPAHDEKHPHIFDPVIAAVKNRIDKTTRPWAEKVREYANKIANTLASSENIDETIALEREKEPLHIDISGRTVGKDIDGNKILCNPQNDVIEYLDWPNRWLQYFTLASAKRETAINGKQLIKTAKDCRVQIEKKYRPRTRMMFQETNQSILENHDAFIENEKIPFYGALNSKRKLGWCGDFSGFRCEDGKAFCIEKWTPPAQKNGKTDKGEKWCFYIQELPQTWMFPVFCKRENIE